MAKKKAPKKTKTAQDLLELRIKDFKKDIAWRDKEIQEMKSQLDWYKRHHGGRGTGRP